MKKIDLARHAPPGMELSFHRNLFEIGLVVAFLYSLKFLTRFSRLRSFLYDWDKTGKTLREGAEMADFAYIVDGALLLFYILAFAMLMTAILNYAYHRQGSKSIYLMKRLPERNEIHKRAIPLPVIASLSCLIYAFILRFFYFAVYMIATPNKCLPAGAWVELWRLFR